MLDNPLVSIVMPCYNNAEYLLETVNSVLDQSYRNWELILVDDCSTDSTGDILKGLTKIHSNILAKFLPVNSGSGAARNAGLEIASGRYIAFLDADDVWLPLKLEKQVSFMQTTKSAITHTSYTIINADGEKLPGGVTASLEVDLLLYMSNTEIGMSTSLIDRLLVGDFQLDVMRTRQDSKLWLTLLAKGYISRGVSESLVEYRVRKGQISGNKVKMAIRTLIVFWGVTSIPGWKRLLYFVYYCISAIKKRV